jgi:ABC-type maltose transport system permease subunit
MTSSRQVFLHAQIISALRSEMSSSVLETLQSTVTLFVKSEVYCGFTRIEFWAHTVTLYFSIFVAMFPQMVTEKQTSVVFAIEAGTVHSVKLVLI